MANKIITYKGTDLQCAEMLLKLEDAGIFSFNIEDDKSAIRGVIEEDLVFGYVSEGREKMNIKMIRDRLQEITKKSVNINHIGPALEKRGIQKKSIRLFGNSVRGYLVSISETKDERMIKFLEARRKGMIINGIDISLYSNPDDFNLALKKLNESKEIEIDD